jgi:hypothetical protein
MEIPYSPTLDFLQNSLKPPLGRGVGGINPFFARGLFLSVFFDAIFAQTGSAKI